MQLTSDVILKGPIWAESIDKLHGTIFDTNWDIYALCVTIGMFYDKQIKSDDMTSPEHEEAPRYIPRNMLGHAQNESLLDFMFQTALVTTKLLNLDEDQRLELAFGSSEVSAELDFSPLAFLTDFANYGVTKLHEQVSDVSDVETMESIMTFLSALYENGVNEIDVDEDLSE